MSANTISLKTELPDLTEAGKWTMGSWVWRIFAAFLFGWLAPAHSLGNEESHPNIVYILADDLGMGDVKAFNPAGKIATPHLDRLAGQGMMFTDAHSGSAVCSPTRYGILTGRYAWRSRLKSGVCWGYSKPLIEESRLTIAGMLRQQGYNTACVGKWHVGLEWALKDHSQVPTDDPNESWENIDFTQPITSGPKQLGFDYFFGISASLDMHPYVYLENDRVTSVPDELIAASRGMGFWRDGPVGADFQHIEVLDKLTDKAVRYISEQRSEVPFFLYFPLTAPHTPTIPTEEYQGKSGLNEWADFVMQVDASVGRVMEAVERQGLTDNTLFVFTSDNGAAPTAKLEALRERGHDSCAGYRGHKADIYEGGHRVLFIARWPREIEAGSKSDQVICLTDLMATVADITGFELPENAGEDSVSNLPLFKNPTAAVREGTVHHLIDGSFAIRSGKWKLCLCAGSGGWSHPTPKEASEEGLPKIQLFDLELDQGETNNIASEHPEVVQELTQRFERYVRDGRSASPTSTRG